MNDEDIKKGKAFQSLPQILLSNDQWNNMSRNVQLKLLQSIPAICEEAKQKEQLEFEAAQAVLRQRAAAADAAASTELAAAKKEELALRLETEQAQARLRQLLAKTAASTVEREQTARAKADAVATRIKVEENIAFALQRRADGLLALQNLPPATPPAPPVLMPPPVPAGGFKDHIHGPNPPLPASAEGRGSQLPLPASSVGRGSQLPLPASSVGRGSQLPLPASSVGRGSQLTLPDQNGSGQMHSLPAAFVGYGSQQLTLAPSGSGQEHPRRAPSQGQPRSQQQQQQQQQQTLSQIDQRIVFIPSTRRAALAGSSESFARGADYAGMARGRQATDTPVDHYFADKRLSDLLSPPSNTSCELYTAVSSVVGILIGIMPEGLQHETMGQMVARAQAHVTGGGGFPPVVKYVLQLEQALRDVFVNPAQSCSADDVAWRAPQDLAVPQGASSFHPRTHGDYPRQRWRKKQSAKGNSSSGGNSSAGRGRQDHRGRTSRGARRAPMASKNGGPSQLRLEAVRDPGNSDEDESGPRRARGGRRQQRRAPSPFPPRLGDPRLGDASSSGHSRSRNEDDRRLRSDNDSNKSSLNNGLAGSYSGGTGEGSKKRARHVSGIPPTTVLVKAEEAGGLAEEPEGFPPQPRRSWREGGLLLRPTPSMEAQPEGRKAVKAEMKMSAQSAGTRYSN